MCSAHGPARKRCDVDGCEKVAVQGGRCISHGAKKKLCSVELCRKQAILAGMCKRHNDESVVVGSGGSRGDKGVLCNGNGDIPESLGEKDNTKGRHHRRGLSVFQDMSTVNTIINGTQDRPANGVVDHKLQRSSCPQDGNDPALYGKATHKRGLSLFSENEVQEKIIKNVILI